MCGDRIIPVQHNQYRGCWCPGDARSTHDIKYVEYGSSCITRGRIPTSCVMSVWRNDISCTHTVMFPMENAAHKGFNLAVVLVTQLLRCLQHLMPIETLSPHCGLDKITTIFRRHFSTKPSYIDYNFTDRPIIDNKSAFVQVMAWYHQAPNHNLNQCRPRCKSKYGVMRP